MKGKKKLVYLFKEGKKEDKFLLGGKGANLAGGIHMPRGMNIAWDPNGGHPWQKQS